MVDGGEQDDKIIAVHADDPEYKHFNDTSELPKHRLREITRYALQLLMHIDASTVIFNANLDLQC